MWCRGGIGIFGYACLAEDKMSALHIVRAQAILKIPLQYNTGLLVWFFGQGSNKRELEFSLAFFLFSFEVIDNDQGLMRHESRFSYISPSLLHHSVSYRTLREENIKTLSPSTRVLEARTLFYS